MRVDKHRVILNVPADLRMQLQELREYANSLGFSRMGETFPQWLTRFLREWCRRERRRLRRLERKILQRREVEAYAEEACREAQRRRSGT